MDWKVQRVPYTPSTTHVYPPHYQQPPPVWYVCYHWWTYTDISLLPRVHSLHEGSLLVLDILWLWTNVYEWYVPMINYSIIQSSFIDLMQLCALPSPHHLRQPLIFWYFYCLHSLPFSECQRVEIIKHSLPFGDLSFFNLQWYFFLSEFLNMFSV